MKTRTRSQPGIYVEVSIRANLDRLWELTQEPALHERWDLRFHRILYLPRADLSEPQRFLYETRIVFGLSIKGTGESIGQRAVEGGERISSLKFASEDPKSLIRQGSGYWRYIPAENGVRFLTWYDYGVRFGAFGRRVDQFAFRPLIGWATAWSFDRLRLWVETGQPPECSMALSLIHAVARITLALIWIWHGLVPKLLFHHLDELTMLSQANVSLCWLPWIGVGEIALGVLVLSTWSRRFVFVANALLMILATLVVAVKSPEYLKAAFNPLTLNFAVVAISIMGWLSSGELPSARRCLRRDARAQL